MNANALWQRVRILEIRARRDVTSALAGKYRSVFKGRGIELDEVREYVAGDEIRDIDWNVTARTGRLHSRRYAEERQLTVMFAVDASASLSFGSGGGRKNEVAAEICAMLAFSALRNNDNVGWLLFTDRLERFVPPRRRASNALRLVRELSAFEPSGRRTDIGAALNDLGRLLHRRCLLFIVSDFLDDNFDGALRRIAARHEVIAIQISDPREREILDAGLIEIEDLETGDRVLADTSDARVRRAWQDSIERKRERLKQLFQEARVEVIEAGTDADSFARLLEFFRARQHPA